MAYSLPHSLRQTSARTIKSYYDSHGLNFAAPVNWLAEDKAVVRALFGVIETLPDEHRSQVSADSSGSMR